MRGLGKLVWAAIAVAAALCLGGIALNRGEHVNSIWLVVAAACTYATGYRFYAKFVATRVMALDDKRATPAERLRDRHDFEPTSKWIVFGHHFAAIAGPGPLVGPVLAAQFGYLPGTLWIIIGATLGGAVQDFVILFASLRRDGKSLGQMAREEIGKVAGLTALVVAAILAGRAVAQSAALAPLFTLSAMTLAIAIIVYGFLASALPVWLLLAPRDYLSTFVKLGVVLMLGVAILFVRPELQLPAFTRFVDGTGPIFAGKVFPFCFITIACGAISGFHSLISSGTTPKILAKESHARPVGYGSMALESFVALMAMIAACVLQPGVYFAVNSPAGIVGSAPAAAVATISSWGFPVTTAEMANLARDVGEQTLFSRTGGAPSLALGMAHIFARGAGRAVIGFWYHFAIMFEALFILTILDAGTRAGRFMLQDALGHVSPKLGRTGWMPGVVGASTVIVAAWGYFLVQGVRDPLGGINSLWPLFGIANQLLATIALCVGTTIVLKMHGAKYMWTTTLPLAWLVAVTFTAAWQKIFSPVPAIGFLAQANRLEEALRANPAGGTAAIEVLIFNARLDAAVCGILLVLVGTILLDSMRVWTGILRRTREARVSEAPFVMSRLRMEEL